MPRHQFLSMRELFRAGRGAPGMKASHPPNKKEVNLLSLMTQSQNTSLTNTHMSPIHK